MVESQESQTSEQPAPQAPPSHPEVDKKLPADFSERLSVKIITTFERSMDERESMENVAQLIRKHLFLPGRTQHYIEAIASLIKEEDTARFSGLMWISMMMYKGELQGYNNFMDRLMEHYVSNHLYSRREAFTPEFQTKRSFSADAYDFSQVFINIIKLGNEYYDVITEIYTEIINKEMSLEQERERKKEEMAKSDTLLLKKKEDEPILNAKKLYDDIVDFLAYRGEFKSESLNQKNPNEFISALADRLRNTRRYVIQDIMNRFAMERKKQIEKELSERIASAEEIIAATEPFKKGLLFYWWEKRYNLKYLAIEKVRVTIQVLAILLGLLAAIGGYVGFLKLDIPAGFIVGFIMIIYSKFFCSRRFFTPFYPEDKTKELEMEVGSFTATFRKMNKEQLAGFFLRQLRLSDNKKLVDIMPEYVKYVFSVMPDRQSMIVGGEELSEVMEMMDIELSRSRRRMS